jgi:hypothetical protein
MVAVVPPRRTSRREISAEGDAPSFIALVLYVRWDEHRTASRRSTAVAVLRTGA